MLSALPLPPCLKDSFAVQGSRLTLLFLLVLGALAASGPVVSDEKPVVTL